MLGKPVPDFSLPSTGGPFQISSLRGKKVVLYFYPKDSTPGCTAEGAGFRDSYPAPIARCSASRATRSHLTSVSRRR